MNAARRKLTGRKTASWWNWACCRFDPDILTTSYLLKQLKRESEAVSPYAADPLSLLVLQMEGYQSPLPEELQNALYSEVARILKDTSRGFDMAGEYFLDKFAIILPETGRRGARALAKRLLARLDGYEFRSPVGNLRLKVRVGLAEYTGCRHYEDLLNRALEDLKAGAPANAELKTAGPLHTV